MSVVTNLVLALCPADERLHLSELNAWLSSTGGGRWEPGTQAAPPMAALSDSPTWGGNKFAECCVWGGSYNHLSLPALLERVEAIPWVRPSYVQLLVMEEQMYFRLWMIRDERLEQVIPFVPEEAEDDGVGAIP